MKTLMMIAALVLLAGCDGNPAPVGPPETPAPTPLPIEDECRPDEICR